MGHSIIGVRKIETKEKGRIVERGTDRFFDLVESDL